MNFFRNIFGKPGQKKWFHQHCTRQKSVNENGLACIEILLSYYDRKTSLRSLKQLFSNYIKKNNLQDIIALCAESGLNAEAFSYSAKELKSQKLPVLIFWRSERFVILIAIENEDFCVLDPADQRIEYSFNDFECFYCEEGLAISP